MVSASWERRKSSSRSACEPRAPRWTSEINKVRKRRSGLSSLEESLPMPVHLPDSCDKAMTIHATDGPRTQRRESAARPCDGGNSAMRQSGDKRARGLTGGGGEDSLIVVPAKAGTHNHRTTLLPRLLASSFQQSSRGVWVPAFAGTTRELIAMF